MKPLPTTITVLVTIASLACLALIPPAYSSEKPKLEKKVEAFLKVSDYDRAFKIVDDFLMQHPEKSIGYAMLEQVITAGSSFLNSTDRKRAVKLIDGYIQRHPEKPTGRAMMVRVLAADGKTEDAFTEYSRFYTLGETISPDLLMEIVRGALNHSENSVVTVAVDTVANLGDNGAIATLIRMYNGMKRPTTGRIDMRVYNVTWALGVLGNKQATPALIEALDDGNVHVRISAIEALGVLGDKSAVPYLINAINDEHDDDTLSGVESLGELGDERSSHALHKILMDSEGYHRVRTALALARVGDEFYKEYSVTVLIDILNDNSNKAQVSAAAALAQLGDERGASALIDALDNISRVAWSKPVVIPLGNKGDMRAIPYLIDILNGGYANSHRMRAARVLGELGDKRAVPALLSALRNDGGTLSTDENLNFAHMLTSGVVNVRAAEALVKLEDERGVDYLMDAFNSGDDMVRRYAAVALAELGEDRIVPNLIEILGGNESISLKFSAAEALVKLSR